MKNNQCFWAICLMMLTAPVVVFGQTTAATINGSVTDEAGAVVADARILVSNEETGVKHETRSNGDGSFSVPGLPVGRYTVAISRPGFQTYSQTGVFLGPSVVRTVNAALKVGAVTTEVSVEASVAQVQLATSEVSNAVAQQQVETLPLNGRNYQSLSVLMPGVVNTQAGRALGTGGFATSNSISINGMGLSGTYYTLDGVWNMNTGNMTQTTILPNPDSLEEVRTLQNNYSPKYSIMGASVVMLQTKSGSRAFHGVAFEYVRNNAFDARNFFSPTVPDQKQNIFGGTFSGPVVIPRLYNKDKDKTFFFFSYQTTIRHRGLVNRGASATQDMRNGLFSNAITDPDTGAPFPQNSAGKYVIPQTRLNRDSLALMNGLAELPNNPAGGFLNYLNLNPETLNQKDLEIKGDHNLTAKWRLTGQYFDTRQLQNAPTHQGGFTTTKQFFDTRSKLWQAHLTGIITPNMVNQISAGTNAYVVDLGLKGKFLLSDLPDFHTVKPFNGFLSDRLPLVSFAGGWSTMGISRVYPLNHASDLENTIADDWSWMKGKHFIEAGVNVVASTKRQLSFAASQGEWFFSGRFTNDPIADYLLGNSTSFFQASTARRTYVHGKIVAPYFQDRWKVNRRLTVNAGVRMNFMPFPHAQKAFETIFDPSKYDPKRAPIVNRDGTITPTPNYDPLNGLIRNDTNGVPSNFTSAHQYYWMPMFGFAYDLTGDGKTSVRGGYGITYTRVFTGTDCSYTCGSNYPDVQTLTLVNPKFPNPVGTGSAAPPGAVTVASEDLDLRAAKIQTFSLSVERQLTSSWMLSVGGAANKATDVGIRWDRNQPRPVPGYDFDPAINTGLFQYANAPYLGYSALDTFTSNSKANWAGMLVSLRHAVSKGFFVTASYTWAHGLAENRGNALLAGGSTQDIYRLYADYGSSNVDVRHLLALSYIWNIPVQPTRNLRGFALGGWKYAGITTIQTGFAIDPGLSVANQGLAKRPNLAGPISYPKRVDQWFSPSSFARPANGFFGTAGTGILRGPGIANFDMSFYKDFSITENHRVQFRAEFFNIFNHTNFDAIGTAFGAGTYGRITSARDPRIIEFALRYQF
ncbi:MAG: carboxypeptidase regulatory-like domain-containing protein [Acidobacteria bacterium]|nr:carboxypeptidase regulatory-like domain-containing protein [Acidobacteriota bacterium]